MPALVDLTGETFGRWTVVELVYGGAGERPKWRCVCECGTVGLVQRNNLRSGKSRSCGCTIPEAQRERFRPRRETVERLWAEGKTAREIGDVMGWGCHPSRISWLRAHGYNLPHRRTPEQIARITADSGEYLTRAWAARAQGRSQQAKERV